MAGGKGSRLFPLTLDRAKPAVPFGGRYRIIDFVLSNLANSGDPLGLRADPVQVAVARGACAADLGRARLLRLVRHRRTCADAHGRVLVPRHRRLGLPEPAPHRGVPRRRGAGLRRRPHLQDEHPPDDRLPLPEGGHRDDRLPADPEVGGARVRHRPGRRPAAGGRFSGEARARSDHHPRRSRALPRRRWATTCSRPGRWSRSCAPTPSASRTTTSAATSCRRWSKTGRSSPTTSATTGSAASPTSWRTPTGATSGRSTRTTRPTWTSRTSCPA